MELFNKININMKRILLALVAVLYCSFLSAESFEITFNISGVKSNSAYITVFGDKDKTQLDCGESKLPIENGKFVIKGNTNTQAVIRIFFTDDKFLMKTVPGGGYIPVKSSNLWFIVYPGAKFNVSGSLEGKDFVEVYPTEGTGKGENDIFALLNTKMMPLLNESGNLAIEAEVKKDVLSKEQFEKLNARAEEIELEVAKIREDFIKEYPSSIAALWLMEDMLIRSQIKPSALEGPLSKVDKKYYDNYFYQTVLGRVNGAKMAVVGAKCPNIKGIDQFGKEFSMESLRGKYVIIDFWGTWCGACLAGTPAMKAFRDANASKLQIVGVANDKDQAKWKACIEKNAMNWPNIMQGKGEQDFVAKFNVQGFPTKVLVSPEGIILHRESGESEEFYKKMEELIK